MTLTWKRRTSIKRDHYINTYDCVKRINREEKKVVIKSHKHIPALSLLEATQFYPSLTLDRLGYVFRWTSIFSKRQEKLWRENKCLRVWTTFFLFSEDFFSSSCCHHSHWRRKWWWSESHIQDDNELESNKKKMRTTK
jgi:hypothetical protein